ncbi:MAG: hypothetical protein DHS80DRAFT_33443 [Piptocephalis tieghemiana]|nr:MAG: hypothetical protein DHS80DRAFT_33443 [Piptocephalis tieghemiana]
MLGDEGFKLVLEAKRLHPTLPLPPYNAAGIQRVSRLVHNLHSTQADTKAWLATHTPDHEEAPSQMVKDAALTATTERMKRCLLVYHERRARCLEERVWSGTLEDHSGGSALELAYAEDYAGLMREVSTQWAEIGITNSLVPPKEHFIDVRVQSDCGEILTEHGTVRLGPGTQHYVRRSDVESFIRSGAITQVHRGKAG